MKSLSNKYRSSSSSSSSSVVVPILPFETLSHQSASVRLDNHRHQIQHQHQQDQEQQVIPDCDKQFLLQLQSSLDYWKEHKYKSAWLHIPTSRASLIESLQQQDEDDNDNNKNNDDDDDDEDDAVSTNANSTSNGNTNNLAFDLHHVNTVENTIVLKKWLRPLSEGEDKIPPFATHQVGCAGFVLSDNNELLLVKEWMTSTTSSTGDGSTRTRNKPSKWKLPGGLLDVGETFGEAACRETLEETGVQCEFQSVLAFWHRHHGLPMFDGIKSDLYYVCLLAPKTDNNTINIDPVEISDATWMPVQEYLDTENHPLINHVLKYVYHLDKEDLTSNSKFHSLSSDKQQHQTNTNTNANTNKNGRRRLVPVVEMIEGHVKFGPPDNRRPSFLTYTGRHGDNKQR